MPYTPIDDTDINAPLAANGTVWSTLIANDVEVWTNYTPAFESNPYALASTAAREFRFRLRGGDSLVGTSTARATVAIGVRAVTSGGVTTNVNVRIDDTTLTPLGVAAIDWYDTAATDLLYSAEPREVVISSSTPGGGATLAYHAIRCIYGAGSSAGLYTASGWCKVDSFWSTANRAVPSEVVSRLRSNPVAIARTRPVCVAFHCADTVRAVATKSTDLWGVEDETSNILVGRLQVPYVDRDERTYIVDAYTTETLPTRALTTIAAGSSGAALPQATINVESTAGFESSGTIAIVTADGVVNNVAYTGVTPTSFTPCTGGTSTMTTGDQVYQGAAEYTVRIGSNTETWSGPGWHSWTVRLGAGVPHAVVASINPAGSNKAAIRTLQVWRMEGTSDGRSIASTGATSQNARGQG